MDKKAAIGRHPAGKRQVSHGNCTRPDGNKGCIDCVAYGEQMAEERIIKMLEGLDLSVFGRIVYSENRDELIALIKGESQKCTENGTELPQGENK